MLDCERFVPLPRSYKKVKFTAPLNIFTLIRPYFLFVVTKHFFYIFKSERQKVCKLV